MLDKSGKNIDNKKLTIKSFLVGFEFREKVIIRFTERLWPA